MPGRPGWSLVSMGNYFFKRDVLERALGGGTDERRQRSQHERAQGAPRFRQGHIIPQLLADGGRVFVYDFAQKRIPGEPEGIEPYWRDVGTIDSYFNRESWELRARVPALDLYNRKWRDPQRATRLPACPIRPRRRRCDAPRRSTTASVCEGSIVASASVCSSVLGYDCFVHNDAVVNSLLVLSGCDIGRGARLHRVILDKNCKIEPGTVIGEDPIADGSRALPVRHRVRHRRRRPEGHARCRRAWFVRCSRTMSPSCSSTILELRDQDARGIVRGLDPEPPQLRVGRAALQEVRRRLISNCFMRVVHVASEVAPFAQSGGLADVVAGLPAAQAESHGLVAAVVVPLYRGVAAALAARSIALAPGEPFTVTVGAYAFTGAMRTARVGHVTYGFVDVAALYDRAGTLYGPGGAGEFTDNHVRFAVLAKVALEYGHTLVGGDHAIRSTCSTRTTGKVRSRRSTRGSRTRRARSSRRSTTSPTAASSSASKSAMTEFLGLPWVVVRHSPPHRVLRSGAVC